MLSLNELGLNCRSDKGPHNHNYLRHYDRWFSPLRQEELVILELGVYRGNSLRIWEGYFPQARIYGVDCDPGCAVYASERSRVLIGDAGDPDFLDEVIRASGPPDVIIDDASHNGDHQRFCLEHLFPSLKPGGLYWVEDIQTSYWGWGESFVNYLKGRLDPTIYPGESGWGDPRNHPTEAEIYLARMDELTRWIKGMHFYSGLALLEKWDQSEAYLEPAAVRGGCC